MRICLSCEESLPAAEWRCPSCGFAPEVRAGFPCFAPALADENEDYDSEFFATISELGETNFWRAARIRLVLWALGRYFGGRSGATFLELGCGAGFNLEAIAGADPDLVLLGSDVYVESLEYCRRLLPTIELFQADATRLPFRGELDLIGAFDVIEHIEDDVGTLQQMFAATRPGGGILLTVPQHRFLWSARDELLCHKRRYTRSELVSKVEAAGFEITRVTSFFTLPFPAMVLTVLRNRRPRPDHNPIQDLEVGRLASGVLTRVLDFERWLIRAGLTFPFGGSLFLVAHKQA